MKTRGKICCAALGVVVASLGIAALYVTQYLLRQNLEIREGSLQYGIWLEPSVPIYMQYYVFNVTNSDAVRSGREKPRLMQLGPYTYREHRRKMNITWNSNGTVTYNNLRFWTFEEERSFGTENDTIITANLPLVTVAEAMRFTPHVIQVLFAALADAGFHEELFKAYTMKQLVWGYHDPMMSAAMKLLPNPFYTDFLGIYAGKNYTDDGLWTVKTGANNLTEVGVVDTYNGTRYLHFWTTQWANMINGTDGTLTSPGLTESSVIRMFIPDICRSLFAVYDGTETTPSGILTYRFTSTAYELANISVNPDNIGFCTPVTSCLGAGLLNLSSCQIVDRFQTPVIASLPHFLYADSKYLDSVDGLDPVEAEHRTDIAIEPTTGVVMRLARRMQINLYLKRMPWLAQMANVNDVLLPLLWLNESAYIDPPNEQTFNSMMLLMKLGVYGGYVLLGLGVLTILSIAVILTIQLWRRRKDNYESL